MPRDPAPRWHPIMAAVEDEPAHWRMIDSLGKEYGRIELRRVGDQLRYRAEFRGELIGWATSLRMACERVHQDFLAAHGPGGMWTAYNLPQTGHQPGSAGPSSTGRSAGA